MITTNIFLSSSNVKRTILLVQAVSQDGKLPWCWLYEKSFVTTLQIYISFWGQGGALRQLIINIHSTLYLNSFKIGWDIESYYMKTVIWVSHLVQRKYQRLLKWSCEYVVHVHGNWMLRYLNKNNNCVLPPSSSPSSCTSFAPLSLHTLYILSFSHTQT